MKLLVIVILLLGHFFVFSNSSANASQAVPYTTEGMERLGRATQTVGKLMQPATKNKQEIFSYLINWERKIFAKAGYDYEKTLIKYARDIQDPDFAHNVTTAALRGFFENVATFIDRENLDANKYFSKDGVKALRQIAQIVNNKHERQKQKIEKEQAEIKAQERAQEIELEKSWLEREKRITEQEEENRLKRIANRKELTNLLEGSYNIASDNNKSGELNFKFIDDNRIMVNGYKFDGYNVCTVNELTADYVYDEYSNRFEITYADGNKKTKLRIVYEGRGVVVLDDMICSKGQLHGNWKKNSDNYQVFNADELTKFTSKISNSSGKPTNTGSVGEKSPKIVNDPVNAFKSILGK